MSTNTQTTTQDNTDIKDMTFRQAMSELDRIVGALDANTLELEDSIATYKRGVMLVEHVQKQLDEAQLSIEQLMSKLEGDPSTDPFDNDNTTD